MSLGSVIHSAIEMWYQQSADPNRLGTVLDYLDEQFPQRGHDQSQKAAWQLARACLPATPPATRRKTSRWSKSKRPSPARSATPIRGDPSQTFAMAGKADAIVRRPDGLYLLEHKTAASIDGSYLDKLWTDTQIALYSHYLRQQGYPIVGVIYNILLKARLKQRQGETETEFAARHAELAANNKSGKSTAKRQAPETDEAYQGASPDWYARPEAFHREHVYLSEDRLAMLQEEVWENPHTGGFADSTEPASWGMFEEAVAACRQDADLAGVGFVFTTDDPYCGVDLDDCVDPETGELKPWGASIVDRLDSYTEVSPSGRGVKVFARAVKPGDRCRKAHHDGEVEMYDRARFFTVTGERLEQCPPEVNARQPAIDDLYLEVFGAANTERRPLAHSPAPTVRSTSTTTRSSTSPPASAAVGPSSVRCGRATGTPTSTRLARRIRRSCSPWRSTPRTRVRSIGYSVAPG